MSYTKLLNLKISTKHIVFSWKINVILNWKKSIFLTVKPLLQIVLNIAWSLNPCIEWNIALHTKRYGPCFQAPRTLPKSTLTSEHTFYHVRAPLIFVRLLCKRPLMTLFISHALSSLDLVERVNEIKILVLCTGIYRCGIRIHLLLLKWYSIILR